MAVHLQLRLEGHAADGARRRRVHALVHRLDVDVHAAEIGSTALRPDIQRVVHHCDLDFYYF